MGTEKQMKITEDKGSTTIESFIPGTQNEKLQREAERKNKELADSSIKIFKLRFEIFDLTKKINASRQAKDRKEKKEELKKELAKNELMVMKMGGFEETCAAIGFDVKKAAENNKKDVKDSKKAKVLECSMPEIVFVPTVEEPKSRRK